MPYLLSLIESPKEVGANLMMQDSHDSAFSILNWYLNVDLNFRRVVIVSYACGCHYPVTEVNDSQVKDIKLF